MNGEEMFRQLGGGDWMGAMGILYTHYGRGLSKLLSGAFGITMREAQRIKAGAGLSDATQTRSGKKYETRLLGMAAALQLGALGGALVDKIDVSYDGADIGTRYVSHITGPLRFSSGRMHDAQQDAITALRQGDFATAAEAFGAGVLDEYGGLGGDLGITDYSDIEWEE